MKLTWTDEAWEQYLHWQQTDKAMLKRLNNLIRDAQRSPFSGIGMPEALKHNLSGWWSRRINEEHRLVYRVENDSLVISRCRHHYSS
jgi:toxin YoeB